MLANAMLAQDLCPVVQLCSSEAEVGRGYVYVAELVCPLGRYVSCQRSDDDSVAAPSISESVRSSVTDTFTGNLTGTLLPCMRNCSDSAP